MKNRARVPCRAARPAALSAIVIGSLVLALGCSKGPTGPSESVGGLVLAKKCPSPPCNDGGDGGGTTNPTASVVITTLVAGAGLYGDGLGAYPGEFTSADGNLWIHAPCESGREFRLDLTGQGLGDPFEAVVTDCGFPPRLTIEAGLNSSVVGQTLGTAVYPPSTDMGPATNYYFEDATTTYNVVWQEGIRVTSDSGCVGTDRTYTLSTDPDLADDADLLRRATKGRPRTEPVGPGDGSVVAHLDLEVVVHGHPACS